MGAALAISDFLMAADILHNVAVLRGQVAAQAARDPSLLRLAARRGLDLSDMGEAGCVAAAEWQPRGMGSSSESGDSGSVSVSASLEDSLAARRSLAARALRDDMANRRRRDMLGGYPHPRLAPPPQPQRSPLGMARHGLGQGAVHGLGHGLGDRLGLSAVSRPSPSPSPPVGPLVGPVNSGPARLSVESVRAHGRALGQGARERDRERSASGREALRRSAGTVAPSGRHSSRVRFPEYELVEHDERDEVDEGETSDDPSSSMLSQILSIR